MHASTQSANNIFSLLFETNSHLQYAFVQNAVWQQKRVTSSIEIILSGSVDRLATHLAEVGHAVEDGALALERHLEVNFEVTDQLVDRKYNTFIKGHGAGWKYL